jgi:energy-coupling factor transport system permease protein
MPVGYSVYQEKPSYLHQKLDPRTKFAWMLTMFGLSLAFNNPLPLAILFITNIALGLWAKLRIRDFLPVIVLAVGGIALSVIMWPFYIHQGSVLFRVLNTDITLIGVLYGIAMGLRVALMIAAASLWMMTTSPQKITLGFVKMGLPFKAGMAISTLIRFVPFLIAELQTIIEAQRARGASFTRGSIIKRFKNTIAVVIPLFSRAFMVAQQLALAMDARGFGARNGRTSIIVIDLRDVDRAIMIFCLLIFVTSIIMRILGIGVIVNNYL